MKRTKRLDAFGDNNHSVRFWLKIIMKKNKLIENTLSDY